MQTVPLIPDNAPFTAEQRQWLNGFLAGIFSINGLADSPSAQSTLSAPPAKPLVILFGSQTGTAEGLARKAAKEAVGRGFLPKVVCMENFETLDLAAAENLLVITSTYGDGEPPDNAQGFWAFLSAEEAPRMEGVRYSVLALGDTNYPAFCEFGKKCDARLAELGASRVLPRVDCDLEYEEPAKAWADSAFQSLTAGTANEVPRAGVPLPASAATPVQVGASAGANGPEPAYDRKRPFPAKLLTNRLLNGSGSAKEVRHYEISLADSGLVYEAGDALGVLPCNCPALIGEVIAALGCDGEEAVGTPDGGETSLRLALAQHYEITKPSGDLLKAAAAHASDEEFRSMILDPARREDLKKWLWGREIIDVLGRVTLPLGAAEFVPLLKKLQPRLYSISSSPKAHPDEVHLTVAAVRYDGYGRPRKGVCSTFLADRAGEHGKVPVFVQKSHGFRLPADTGRPVIMVGPGTGIAPFRAFLEERAVTGARGRNWLFFGDQRRDTDYLYREELEAMYAGGQLSRLDLAFSRDQPEKIYVQNRMLESAGELWAWLQEGAHFYVCGDASRMAKDVDAALHQIAETAGGMTREAAAEYVAKLKSDKRYQRDVY